MKQIIVVLALAAVTLASCVTASPAESVAEPMPEEPVQPQMEEEPAVVEDEPEEEVYLVSEEVFNQTFEEIEALIMELNQVISRRQYSRWLTYLSAAYKSTYNSPEKLDGINQLSQMKDNNIVLKDLKGYFDWVVVPSRSRAVLGEIVFVGETQVVAYSSFEGQRAKLYELERINGDWKITVW